MLNKESASIPNPQVWGGLGGIFFAWTGAKATYKLPRQNMSPLSDLKTVYSLFLPTI